MNNITERERKKRLNALINARADLMRQYKFDNNPSTLRIIEDIESQIIQLMR